MDADRIARGIFNLYDPKFYISGTLRQHMIAAYAEAIRAAHRTGYEAAREQAAEIVVENYQGLSQEHRLLLVNRAVAIRSMEPK